MPAHWRSLSEAACGGLQGARPLLFLLLLGMAMQFLGVAAPGCYNHDETQWFIRSQELGASLWEAWVGQWSSMQWRPLSRTAWLLLVCGLHETPILMHAATALIVVASAALLHLLPLRVFRQPAAALAGFVAFCAFHSTAWVAGWVAAIADGMAMLPAVALAHVLLTDRNEAVGASQARLPFRRPRRGAGAARRFLVAGPRSACCARSPSWFRRPPWRDCSCSPSLGAACFGPAAQPPRSRCFPGAAPGHDLQRRRPTFGVRRQRPQQRLAVLAAPLEPADGRAALPAASGDSRVCRLRRRCGLRPRAPAHPPRDAAPGRRLRPPLLRARIAGVAHCGERRAPPLRGGPAGGRRPRLGLSTGGVRLGQGARIRPDRRSAGAQRDGASPPVRGRQGSDSAARRLQHRHFP